jgi:hypothetical protein
MDFIFFCSLLDIVDVYVCLGIIGNLVIKEVILYFVNLVDGLVNPPSLE